MGFKKEINDSSAITSKNSKLNYGRVKFDIKLAQATADNGFVYEAYKLREGGTIVLAFRL